MDEASDFPVCAPTDASGDFEKNPEVNTTRAGKPFGFFGTWRGGWGGDQAVLSFLFQRRFAGSHAGVIPIFVQPSAPLL